MKKFMPLLLAGMLGSAVMYGTIQIFEDDANVPLKVEHVSSMPVQGAMYTADENGEIIPMDFTAPAEAVMKSVVHIRSTSMQQMTSRQLGPSQDPFEFFFGPRNRGGQNSQPTPRVGSGSGVIINDQGYIVTNNHVIDNASDIEVTLSDNRSYKARLIGTDPNTDIAVIQIQEKGLPSIRFEDSDNIKVGEWVLAVGNPLSLNSTVTAGIVSAKARNINILQRDYAIESFIQTDAAINPGNSGGALVNLSGNLIGINTAIASPTGTYAGYGFAVPSNIVSKVVEDLIEFGVVQRGFLGVQINNITSDLAREYELDVVAGAYIASVIEGSAGELAGLNDGDVIVGIDGRTINSSAELLEYVGRKRPGDKVSLQIRRDGKELSKDVILKNEDGSTELLARIEPGSVKSVLGAEMVAIDAELANKLGIAGGVKVLKLNPGLITQQVEMKEGFIITKVDGKAVKTPEDVERLLSSKSGGILLEGMYEGEPGIRYYGLGV
ncbi:Do family serine endopeptidase [Fulvivirgaceae bacterium LMO-SS25]